MNACPSSRILGGVSMMPSLGQWRRGVQFSPCASPVNDSATPVPLDGDWRCACGDGLVWRRVGSSLVLPDEFFRASFGQRRDDQHGGDLAVVAHGVNRAVVDEVVSTVHDDIITCGHVAFDFPKSIL